MSDNPDDLLQFFDNPPATESPVPQPVFKQLIIASMLKNYTDLEGKASGLRQEYENIKFSLIPDEIRQKIMEVDRQQQEQAEKIQAELASMKAEIVRLTEEFGESVNTPKGVRSAIFSIRTEWDSKRLEGYAIAHPDVLQLQSKKVVITIR